jgi:DNA-binding NarL/FixJ family response regulator
MRVVIAEDHALLREGIVALLREAGVDVVGQAEDGEGLLRIVAGHKPDLAIVDVRLPPSFTDEGIRAAIEARRRLPGLAILILSQYVEPVYTAALQVLTPREREVLSLMAEGRTNAAIARELVVTPGAVEKHISNVFAKLDLPASDDDHRRVRAGLTYLRSGG